MSRSVFSGLSLARAPGGVLEIRYPRRLHDAGRAAAVARAHGLEVAAADANSWSLRLPATGPSPAPLKAFFAELNGAPAPYPLPEAPRAPAAPLVSAVIVVNENVDFVREQLVPSLVANSPPDALEIVLVYNGAAPEEPALGAWPGLRSAWGAVAAAYNAGARAARGRYVALLHDDCIIDDAAWIDKCVRALEGGAAGVAGEFRRLETIAGIPVPPLPVAKCVPLVLAREALLEIGGYDEFHYVGYEDLDLTLAFARRGLRFEPAGLKLRHYAGMSSTLKYCPVPGLAELYALAAVPAAAVLRRFREFAERGLPLEGVDLLRLALDAQLYYVLRKYHYYLDGIDARAYASAAAALERRITAGCPFDATLILPRFREIDRALRP
jgi:hypothetical protein